MGLTDGVRGTRFGVPDPTRFKTLKLTTEKKNLLINAYGNFKFHQAIKRKPIKSPPIGPGYVQVALKKEKVTLYVPAKGDGNGHLDPNTATKFYVGDQSGKKARFYGPFDLKAVPRSIAVLGGDSFVNVGSVHGRSSDSTGPAPRAAHGSPSI